MSGRLVKGVLWVEAVVMACPACEEPIDHPKTGSQMWKPSDLAEMFLEEIACPCGQRVQVHIPAWLKSRY